MKDGIITDEDLDLSSLDDDDASATVTNTEFRGRNNEYPVAIAASEARWVLRSKLLVLLAVISATTVCAFAVFTFTSSEEEKNFANQVRAT